MLFKGGKMNRKQVYKRLDGERFYQDHLPKDRTSGLKHTVGDYLVMLNYYMDKANEAWTMNAGDEDALDVGRKIGGIAVHCMEDHGAPEREMDGLEIKVKRGVKK